MNSLEQEFEEIEDPFRTEDDENDSTTNIK